MLWSRQLHELAYLLVHWSAMLRKTAQKWKAVAGAKFLWEPFWTTENDGKKSFPCFAWFLSNSQPLVWGAESYDYLLMSRCGFNHESVYVYRMAAKAVGWSFEHQSPGNTVRFFFLTEEVWHWRCLVPRPVITFIDWEESLIARNAWRPPQGQKTVF